MVGKALNKVREIFQDINWKIIIILALVPMVDFIATRDEPKLNLEALLEALGEMVVLICIGAYVSHKIKQESRVKHALMDSEARFRSIYESSPVSIAITEKGGKVQAANPACCELFGYSEEELKSLTFSEISHPGEIEENLKLYSAMLEGKSDGYRMEKRYYHKDGHVIWGDLATTAVRDKNGDFMYNFAMVVDISERKKAEGALKESKERFKTLFNKASDAIFISSQDGSFIEVNDIACERLGYTRDELLQMSPVAIDSPESAKRVPQRIQQIMANGYYEFESEHVTKDKKVIPVEINAKMIEYAGKPAILATARDITERKKAKDALANSLRFMQNLIDNIPNPIFYKDAEGVYQGGNKAWLDKILGLRRTEVIGRKLFEFPHQIPEDLAKTYHEQDLKLMEKPGIQTYEHKVQCSDGVRRDFLFNKATYDDIRGNVAGIVGIMLDLTERKNAEEQLERIEKLESLGVLAGGIAHDFNNLLSAILSNIELAARDSDRKSKQYSYLIEGQEAVLRAKDLTQQLLTFSRGGAPIKAPESIERIIEDTADFVLHGSSSKVVYNFEESLDFAEVDAGQMSQVIQNLVINADQSMPEGGIIVISAKNVSIDSHISLKDGKYIEVTIKDHGIGVPKKHIKNIFDPYFSTKQKGSGLGLAIVYSIINAHSGDIVVDSVLGEGTSFTFYLPAVERIEADKTLLVHEYQEGSGQSILLLEDDKHVSATMAEVLKELGYTPEITHKGREAVELYKKRKEEGNPFDLVIADLTIPGGMGGEEANKKILEIDPEAVTVASSGYANDPIMANYKEYGFKGVLKKPVKFDEIGALIHKILNHQ
jgi:PAS domain S-box-containing protein